MEDEEYYYLKPIEPKNKPMSNKTRLIIWAVFAVIAITLGLLNKGFHQTWPMLLAFLVLGVGYEVINHFVIKKRLK